jgi:hypothetical protein
MASSYFVGSPDGPFATLAAVILSAGSQQDRRRLKGMASAELLASMPVFRAELHAALHDPGRLPDDEMFRSAEFGEAFLSQLWLDVYGDKPSARTADELDRLLNQREAERSARRAAQRASGGQASPAGLAVAPPCAECGQKYARVEVIPPGQLPEEFAEWTVRQQARHLLVRDLRQWYLICKGIAAEGNHPISAERAAVITAAFQPPLTYAKVHSAGFEDDSGFCGQCDAVYCYQHWHVTVSGYGWCPRRHGKSLDPHWFPEELSGQPAHVAFPPARERATRAPPAEKRPGRSHVSRPLAQREGGDGAPLAWPGARSAWVGAGHQDDLRRDCLDGEAGSDRLCGGAQVLRPVGLADGQVGDYLGDPPAIRRAGRVRGEDPAGQGSERRWVAWAEPDDLLTEPADPVQCELECRETGEQPV